MFDPLPMVPLLIVPFEWPLSTMGCDEPDCIPCKKLSSQGSRVGVASSVEAPGPGLTNLALSLLFDELPMVKIESKLASISINGSDFLAWFRVGDHSAQNGLMVVVGFFVVEMMCDVGVVPWVDVVDFGVVVTGGFGVVEVMAPKIRFGRLGSVGKLLSGLIEEATWLCDVNV